MKKRCFDLLLIIPSLFLLSPLMAAVALLIGFTMGRPILFRQTRPGLHGAAFTIYKFRTMSDRRDKSGNLLPDGERITRIGRFLRATSLDELPELFNVLKDDMSIVGPRPLLMRYLDRYTPEQARRHEVKPGLTGWAQVNGRNAISWQDKFKLDVWYVDNQSIWLDLKTIGLTMWKVLKREGINQAGQTTAQEFVGSFNVDGLPLNVDRKRPVSVDG